MVVVFVGMIVFASSVTFQIHPDSGTKWNILSQGNFSHLEISNQEPFDNLILYFPFDIENISNGTVYDYTSFSNDGFVEGATFNSSGGHYGGGYDFDGEDDYVNLSNFVDLDGASSFSISMWVYFKESSFGNVDGIFGRGTDNQRSPWIFGHSGNSDVYFNFETDSGTGDCTVLSSTNLNQDSWTHLVAVWNGTHCYFFFDGIQDSALDDTSGSALVNTDGSNRIGSIDYLGGTYFNGSIDEVMVFNTSLNSTQISGIYNNQSNRFKSWGFQSFESDLEDNPSSMSVLNSFSNLSGSEGNLTFKYYDDSWSSGVTHVINSSNFFYVPLNAINFSLNYTYYAGSNNGDYNFYSPILKDSSLNYGVALDVSEPQNATYLTEGIWINGTTIQSSNVSYIVDSGEEILICTNCQSFSEFVPLDEGIYEVSVVSVDFDDSSSSLTKNRKVFISLPPKFRDLKSRPISETSINLSVEGYDFFGLKTAYLLINETGFWEKLSSVTSFKKESGNDYFANNGMSQPVQGVAFPQGEYVPSLNRTYVVWQGQDLDPYIKYYDHNSNSWSASYNVGTNPLSEDDHGAPAIAIDDEGYIHVFFGAHSTGFKYYRSSGYSLDSFSDKSGDLSAVGSYAVTVKGDGKLFFIYRGNAGTSNLEIKTSSDNGDSWSRRVLVNFSENIEDSIYPGNAIYRDGAIHFSFFQAYGHTQRRTVYYALYNVSTGNVSSISGEDFGSEINELESYDTDAEVWIPGARDSSGHEVGIPRIAWHGEEYPMVLWPESFGDSGWYHEWSVWNGSAWTTPQNITRAENDNCCTSGSILSDKGTIEAYLPEDFGSDTDRGGNITKWTFNGTMFNEDFLIASTLDYNYSMNAPTEIRNFRKSFKVLFSEVNPSNYTYSGLKIFGYGESSIYGSPYNFGNSSESWNFVNFSWENDRYRNTSIAWRIVLEDNSSSTQNNETETKIFNIGNNAILDLIFPEITSMPENYSVNENTDWTGADFDAKDNWGIDFWFTNDSAFSINSSGYLDNSSNLSSGRHLINVSVNDTSGNLNYTFYLLVVNESSSDTSSDVTTPPSSASSLASSFTPSKNALENSYDVKITSGQKVRIIYGNDSKTESIEVKEISEGKVLVSVDGTDYEILNSSSEKIDLDGDGYYDVEISNVKTYSNGFANLEFTLINGVVPANEEDEKNENVFDKIFNSDKEEGEKEISFWKHLINFLKEFWERGKTY